VYIYIRAGKNEENDSKGCADTSESDGAASGKAESQEVAEGRSKVHIHPDGGQLRMRSACEAVGHALRMRGRETREASEAREACELIPRFAIGSRNPEQRERVMK
jgi:hypothetical protein